MLRSRDDEALEAYKKAVEVAPQSPAPKQRLVELVLRQNKLTEASQYTDELLKTKDGKAAGHYYRGLIALAKNQTAARTARRLRHL